MNRTFQSLASPMCALLLPIAAAMVAAPAWSQGLPGNGIPGGVSGATAREGRVGGFGHRDAGADGKRGETRLRPHPFAMLAERLDKQLTALQLSPAGTAAMHDFIRELRDNAAMDDRRARVRLGWMRAPVHAVVDLQRDLQSAQDDARDVAAEAADLVTRWNALNAQLDEPQRQHVEAIYGAVLLDANAPPQDTTGDNAGAPDRPRRSR